MPEAAETPAAARRRRWITLGELVAVLALLISAASFWDARQQRQREDAVEDAAGRRASASAPLILTASVDNDGTRLKLAAAGDAVLQTQTVSFPKAVRGDSEETSGNPHIDAAWFESGLRAALGSDARRGRLPVGIVTHYLDNGRDGIDTALYEIAFTVHPRLLRTAAIELEGMTLVARNQGAALQQRLDTRWSRAHPDKIA